jgi:hypothetical protein
MRESMEDLNKYRHISCSRFRRLDIVKMEILSKMTYRFITITSKIPVKFYKTQIGKLILESIWKCKGRTFFILKLTIKP